MSSSCLPLLVATLFTAEQHLEAVIPPGLRVDIANSSEHLESQELVRLLRLELGTSAQADRVLVIDLHESEAQLTVRGECEEAQLHDVLPLQPDLGASRARIVALAAAEFVRRELPPCPVMLEERVEEPATPPTQWLPTLQPFIGARVLFTKPGLMPNGGVEVAMSTSARAWWGELALFLQGTRVTQQVGVVEVWAPTVSLGLRHEWGERWRFGLGVRTEASLAIIKGTANRPDVSGRQSTGLLLGSSGVLSLHRHLTGMAWFTAELGAGYGWRGIDVRIDDARALLVGGFWLDVRLGVSFDLSPARPQVTSGDSRAPAVPP